MVSKRVLVSGAGIAGSTVAYWLTRAGFDVTLVELAGGIRSSGAPVDVRGDALPIVARMGVLDQLREVATIPRQTVIVDDHGAPLARLATQNSVGRRSPSTSSGTDATGPGRMAEIELARPDLARILLGTVTDDVELIYGDSIKSVGQDRGGADVILESGREDRFDLVIGADGVHSRTRSLLFGPESGYARHLGLYIGGMLVADLPDTPQVVQHYNLPGRSVTIHPARGVPMIAFIFRSPRLPEFDHRDLDQHRRMILQRYADARWRTPELLGYVRTAPDIYFDAVTRIALRSWSSGRVVLVGDAASSVSLLGDGSTKAIIGAHTLAHELAACRDHSLAFRRYQHEHARRISPGWQVRATTAFLVPKTRIGIGVRDRVLRTALARRQPSPAQ